MAVTYHDYSSTEALPHNVLDLVHRLRKSTHEDISPSSVDAASLEQFDAALREALPHPDAQESYTWAKDILRFVLSKSRSLNQLRASDDDFGPREMRPVWHSWLSMLGKATFTNSVTL